MSTILKWANTRLFGAAAVRTNQKLPAGCRSQIAQEALVCKEVASISMK
jgi:hypothetical protein